MLVATTINLLIKFEVSSSTHSKDMMGPQKFRSGSCNPHQPPKSTLSLATGASMSRGMGNGSLKVDNADKGYNGGPKEGTSCVKSQTYQGAATKYK